jgi:hypothetical protein
MNEYVAGATHERGGVRRRRPSARHGHDVARRDRATAAAPAWRRGPSSHHSDSSISRREGMSRSGSSS